ncbi:hypothetical protein EAE96_003665 [Botrytis aclada]|nr:hypothetical protein EAE96_003665 [Botrytis aclada]
MYIDAFTIQGIAVSNSPANIGIATADATTYLFLSALRRSWISSLSIRNGQWRGHAGLGHDPEGKILGILGMGNIGSVVAKRAAAFDMHIQYHNRNPLPVERIHPGTKYVFFEELLQTSDIISVHLSFSDDTRYTLGSNEYARMKDGAILINTSRGPILDEQALVDALDSGKLYSAGLYVFENESQVHPKLLANENITLTPHMAAGTVETILGTKTFELISSNDEK